jgi:hypothetical protein
MSREDYFADCLAESFDEHGVTSTPEQLKAVAKDVALAQENIGMAFYEPENPAIRELSDTKRELAKERSKIGCRPCGGTGRLRYNSGPWGVDTQCDKCHGEGKHVP